MGEIVADHATNHVCVSLSLYGARSVERFPFVPA